MHAPLQRGQIGQAAWMSDCENVNVLISLNQSLVILNQKVMAEYDGCEISSIIFLGHSRKLGQCQLYNDFAISSVITF